MASCTHVFQISGIMTREEKRLLVQGIQQLGGKYIGGSVYQHSSTHLIIPKVFSSEKFLAACAAGKWVVTPGFVLDSVKNGSWLAEEPHEISISHCPTSSYFPVREWRKKVSSGQLTGAFQGWTVLLMVQEPNRRAMFTRLLKAGKAKVYSSTPPPHATVTHVMAKSMTEDLKSYKAPFYPLSHIVQHLFGSNCGYMKFNIMDICPAELKKEEEEEDSLTGDFSKLETELKDYVIKHEARPRLYFLGFLGYSDPHRTQSQAVETDFCKVDSLIECGLFHEALDLIRDAMFPGLLPPAPSLVSLFEHAQQGYATSIFLGNFREVLHHLLVTNPPWQGPSAVKKFFTQVLQCPRCKEGLLPFLESAISYCLSSKATCHPLPGPGRPTLLQFHSDLLAFFLKLFQGELQSVSTGDFLLPEGTGTPQASASGSLLYGTFWTVWERSTLLSRAIKQFAQLLVEAAVQDYGERGEEQELHLADTLLDMLCVLVEFWCQQHSKLNQHLVDKGLKDLAEHFAVISQDVPVVVLEELVVRFHSTRLKLVMADALFRNLCCRNGITVGDDPLTLKKMVLSYLPALGSLAQAPTSACLRTGHTSHSCSPQGSSCSAPSSTETSMAKTKISPKGLNRINIAGETLLHRACKRNQVETVHQILALPGTDVNVKDNAGWTPLHEACNHGSTACVEALLHHRPAPMLNSLVYGVSPLHDALKNGHMDIAKLLLEHAGSALLQQTDENSRSPLDLLSDSSQREELLRIAQVRDSALKNLEVSNLPLLEAGASLLASLLCSYRQEHSLSGCLRPSLSFPSLGSGLFQALRTHSLQHVTQDWKEQRALRLAQDAATLLELSRATDLAPLSQALRECKSENAQFLLEILENMKSWGEV